ncbi:MAG: response regulator [Limisphaerales bacterium]
MKEVDQKSIILYVIIAISLGVVFLMDLYTPLGVAGWLFYFIPIVLSYFVWRPQVPFIIAAAVTLGVILGYVISPAGVDLSVARINRSFLTLTIWALAIVGFQFIRNKLAVRKEEWLQTGQMQLSEKMVGEPALGSLGETVLRYLAEYLGAQAGLIYIEENGIFRRFASYGVPSGANVPQQVGPGDGLLGQAISDKRLMVIRNVPDGYLTVGSALGKSSPRHLLVAPIGVDGKVNGILELGFFGPIAHADRELIRRVSESIGVAVRSAHYRTQLQLSLEQTQRQAEELQTQSEELRVTNEELSEQSRALKESQAHLEQQQAELEQINLQLEQQTNTLALQRDQLERAKSALEKQTQELQQASNYKSAFLANMSHELRTPLNSSLILSKLLADNREGNLTPEQIKYARTIESAGNDLLALINDVLDLSKVEAGHMEVKPQLVRISSLVESLRSTFQAQAEQKGLALQVSIAPGTPETLFTDSQRLEQVLKNLLSNAIKFTEKGEVALEINRVSDGRIAFAIRDTGIGIAENQQEVIFEPFRQADGSTNRKYGGTGLGLSISREFVRLLGGDMLLNSVAGKGSTFTVLLPEKFEPSVVAQLPKAVAPVASTMQPTSMTPKQVEPRPSLPVGRVEDDRQKLTGNNRVILTVEDDETFARIIYDLVHELGFQCVIATSAEEAMALAAQYLPSAVILDLGLPDHSGLSVLDRLKADARTRHIPVHVVSASDHADTAYAMGAAGYMLKPVKRDELAQSLHKLENRLTQRLRRVLIVEDNAVQLESISRLLGTQDVETEGATSAGECLEKLRTSTFDCMVLDLSLPDASGFALLETLSREDKYSFPPVIVYTGRKLSPEEEQRLRKYSKSIIIKGAKSPERLLDEVTLFLHQVVADLPAEQQEMLEKARSRDAALEGRHVLVVEDDVRNIFALSSILEPHGVKLQIARNGREALEFLDRSLQNKGTPVDLVLMDIMMPEMDGLTAMREIRKRPEWKKLPIIALTAKAMKNDQEEAIAAGANDYMSKPLDVDKLLSLIRVWMPR